MEHLGLDVWNAFVDFFFWGWFFVWMLERVWLQWFFLQQQWERNHLGKFRDLGFKIRKNEWIHMKSINAPRFLYSSEDQCPVFMHGKLFFSYKWCYLNTHMPNYEARSPSRALAIWPLPSLGNYRSKPLRNTKILQSFLVSNIAPDMHSQRTWAGVLSKSARLQQPVQKVEAPQNLRVLPSRNLGYRRDI